MVSLRRRAPIITDWDEKAVAVVSPIVPAGVTQSVYVAQRVMGMVHAAMFDAVNSIERRYRPYLAQLPATPPRRRKPPLRRQPLRYWRQLIQRQRVK